MSAADIEAMIKAFGLPGGIIIFVWFLLIKNGGLKTIFRDELREEIEELKKAINGVSEEVHKMSTELAVLKDRSNRKGD